MSEFHLRRRIPPMSLDEIVQQLVDDTNMPIWDAREIAIELHAANMEVIYRLARIGEAFERLRPYTEGDLAQVIEDGKTTEHWMQYWTGLSDGWNGARQWVIDNTED